MKALIEIECDSKTDFLSHLQCIKEQSRKIEEKKFNFDDFIFEDDNCYGYHEVRILNGESEVS